MLNKPKRCFSHSRKIVRELYSRFRRHNISYTAGQIAYFFILSVFPFLIFVNALIASFDIPGNAAISFLEPLFPEQIVSFIAQYLEYINTQSGVSLLSFGIFLALFSASKSVRSLNSAFNRAYHTEQTRGFFAQVLFSMIFILLFALIFLACVVLVAFGNDFVSKLIASLTLAFAFVDLFSVWRWITMAVILFFTMSVIYKIIPSKKIKFSETIPGTLFSIVGFLILTGGFSFYVNHIVSSSLFYGSVGAVMLLMLWMYFAGMILLLGAELNSIMTEKDI